jgi:hypothetical protein
MRVKLHIFYFPSSEMLRVSHPAQLQPKPSIGKVKGKGKGKNYTLQKYMKVQRVKQSSALSLTSGLDAVGG